jgi:protein TonB
MVKSVFLLVFSFVISSLYAQEGHTIKVIPAPSLNENEIEENVPLAVIEVVPQFPACKNAEKARQRDCFQEHMNLHVRKNFNYPKEAYENKISGRVFVSFTIDKEGKVTNISTRGEAILCKEAERIVQLLPTFIPGQMRGVNVSTVYTMPITFRLD